MGLNTYLPASFVDAATGSGVAGVIVQITDLETGLPVPTYDENGAGRPVITNYRGYSPTFWTDDTVTQINAKAGGVVLPMTAQEMIGAGVQAAEEARDAALAAQHAAEVAGGSLPAGGGVGQVLAKASLADSDVAWVDPGVSSVTAAAITDSSTVGRAVLTAIDAPAARAALGAGTGTVSLLQSTTVYVNKTTGLDTNPGTSAQPLKTVQEAVNRAQNAALTSGAVWTIVVPAGTYTERVRFADYTSFALFVKVQGPDVGGHPNVPTAVFSEGAGTSAVAFLNRNPNTVLTLQDIKFVGYNGTTSSSGVTNLDGQIFTVNTHADSCFYGISSQHGTMDVKGGILNNNGRLPNGSGTGAAIRSLMLNRHSIGTQNAGTTSLSPIFTNNRYGMWAQESSTGHVDWCRFEDNEFAVVVRANSRTNLDGSSFKRNLNTIVADSSSHVYIPDTVVFGTGADANGRPPTLTSGANPTSTRMVVGAEASASRSERALTGIYTQQSSSGTAETDMLNRVLAAPFWGGQVYQANNAPIRLKVRMVGTLTGTVGTKSVFMRMGAGLAGVTFSNTETGTFVFEGMVLFVSETRQVLHATAMRHLSTSARTAVVVAAEDLTVDQVFRATIRANGAGDSIAVEYVELYWG